MSQVTRICVLVQITFLEPSITQHRAEYTQELSNIQKGHSLSHTEKRRRPSELESSSAVAESSVAGLQKTQDHDLINRRRTNAVRTDVSFLQRSPEEADGAARRLKISNESPGLTLQNVTEERNELDALQQQSVGRLATALERANRRVQGAEQEAAVTQATVGSGEL